MQPAIARAAGPTGARWGDGQAICGTRAEPLKAATSRSWPGSRAPVAQDPTVTSPGTVVPVGGPTL